MSGDDPKPPSDPTNPLDELGRSIGEAAAREAGRRVVDGATEAASRAVREVREQVSEAIDRALRDTETDVTTRAKQAEARRAASSLPDPAAPDPDWAAAASEAGDQAFQRAQAHRDEPTAAPTQAERRATAQRQLEALRAARHLTERSDRTPPSVQAASRADDDGMAHTDSRVSERDLDDHTPPSVQASTRADDDGMAQPDFDARLDDDGARAAAQRQLDALRAARSTGADDPAAQALERAAAARRLAAESDGDERAEPRVEGATRADDDGMLQRDSHPASEPEAPADPGSDGDAAGADLDPAERALARARAARGDDDLSEPDPFDHLDPAERALARARAARGDDDLSEPDPFDHLDPAERALARARAARGAPAEAPSVRSSGAADDPLAAARQALRAGSGRRAEPTPTPGFESAAERIARVHAEAAAAPRTAEEVLRRATEIRAQATGAPRPAVSDDPVQRLRRQLERAEPSPPQQRSDLLAGSSDDRQGRDDHRTDDAQLEGADSADDPDDPSPADPPVKRTL